MPQVISDCIKNTNFSTSYGEQIRDFTYVEDIVLGIFNALDSKNAHGEVINLASGRPVSIKSVVEKISSMIGGQPDYGAIAYRAEENMSLYADVRKAYKLLNWEPRTTLDDGLEKTIAFYRK